MKGLVFGVDPEPWSVPDGANRLTRNLAASPMALTDLPDARPLRRDWVVTRPLLTGICGSDAKQVLLDFGEGDTDSAMSGLCSFPQVMGHEVVAEVTELGPEATGVEVGQRVVLNPWLSCAPRGITPVCPACAAGDLSLCWSFTTGDISSGIHTGVSSDATGGYAELMPAHSTMLFPVPDGVDDEQAIFADPFAVSLHSVTRHPPPPGGKVLVWGAGSLGLVRRRHPALPPPRRRDRRRRPVRRPGRPGGPVRCAPRRSPRRRRSSWSRRWPTGREAILRPTMEGLDGLPMCHPGGIDVAYDTVGKAETFEVEVRVLKARGTLVEQRRPCPGPVGVEPALLQGDQPGSGPTPSGSRRSTGFASTASSTTSTWSSSAAST